MRDNIKLNSKKSETMPGDLISRKAGKRLFQTKNKNSPVDHILHLQRTMGNRAVTRLFQAGAIQARLTIGKPNDIYEKEADSVADRVMSMKDPKQSSAQNQSTCPECPEKEGIQTKPLAEQITPLIQRQAETEEEEVQSKIQRQATEEEEEPVQTKLSQRQGTEEEEEPVQTKLLQRQESEEEEKVQTKLQRQAEEEEKTVQADTTTGNTHKDTPNIESDINSMKGGGQPLSESTRSFFEPRFGADFSQVRVHTDDKAGKTARSINAQAFTTGKDIVFGSGQYSPGTSTGKQLLAHELTHVVQQSQYNFVQKLDSIKDKSKFGVLTRGINHQAIQRKICRNPPSRHVINLIYGRPIVWARRFVDIKSPGRLIFWNSDKITHRIRIYYNKPLVNVSRDLLTVRPQSSEYTVVTLRKRSRVTIDIVLTTGKKGYKSFHVVVCP